MPVPAPPFSTTNEASCGEFGVRGYPTIKFFGKNKQSPEDYNGGRDTSSIVLFATQHWAKSAPPPEVRELVDEHVFEKVSYSVTDRPHTATIQLRRWPFSSVPTNLTGMPGRW